MLCLISIDASIKVKESGNSEKRPHRELLNELKNWIFDTINKPFPPNCQKPFEERTKNVKYLVQKVSCQQGAKKR